jgi:hypothetical protein
MTNDILLAVIGTENCLLIIVSRKFDLFLFLIRIQSSGRTSVKSCDLTEVTMSIIPNLASHATA